MLDCLILGDSIAKGISDVRPECVAYVESGINSRNWLNKNVQRSPYEAKAVIISLGTNDLKPVYTEDELDTIRRLTRAERVFWIMPPIKPQVQASVKKIAEHYGDTIISTSKVGPDHVHPTYSGYKELGDKTK
jgi:lysophospholipase L1-like esterase